MRKINLKRSLRVENDRFNMTMAGWDVPYSHLVDMHYNAKCNVIQFRIHHYK